MTTEDAKTYLAKRQIPSLMESLMTGLMYHRPTDHITYLIDCLQKCQGKSPGDITWSAFVDIRRTKTPLPPIGDKKRPSSKEGPRPSSKTRPKGEEVLSLDMANMEDSIVSRVISPDTSASARQGSVTSPTLATSRTSTPDTQGRSFRGFVKEEPTPRSDTTKSPLPAIPTSTTTEKASLPDAPIVLVMGAPGLNKEAQVNTLLERYPGWQHVNMGTLIREEIGRRGDAHTKWKLTKDLMSRGEPAQEEVTIEVLMEGLKKCSGAKGIVITGFPRSMEQVTDYEASVGRVDVAFMIDCDEAVATDRLLRKGKNSNRPEDSMSAIANKINFFKANTLAAFKYFDDQGKLCVIEGEKGDAETTHELGKAFDKLFLSKYGTKPVGDAPPRSTSATSSIPEPSTYKGKYEKDDSDDEKDDDKPMYEGAVPEPPTIVTPDTGRKPDLPQCPIIFVAGGPGSGKGTQCQRIIKRYPDLVHLSMGDIIRTEITQKGSADDVWGMVATLVSKGEMAPEEVTIDLLKAQLLKHKDAKGFLIEGFPRDSKQLEAFNKHIGGLNFCMLFDCEEYYMKARLVKRGRESGRIDDNLTAIGNRIKFYKYNTIPLMKALDDEKKLVVRDISEIDADRDLEAMFYDICNLFDFAFFGKSEATQDTTQGSPETASQDQPLTGPTQSESASQDETPETTEPAQSESVLQGETRDWTEQAQSQSESVSQDTTKPAQSESVNQNDKANTEAEPVQSGSSQEAEAAVKIQAGFRGYMVRKKPTGKQGTNEAEKEADEPNNRQEPVQKQPDLTLTDSAAMTIKAGFAAYKQRQESRSKLTNLPDQEKIKQAATKKQTSNPNKNASMSDKSEKELAGMQIRAGFKGHFIRQQPKSGNKAGKEGNAKERDVKKEQGKADDDKSAAATQIRAAFRGHMTRQETVKRKETKPASDSAPVQEEVVEPTIAAEGATTTGDNVENPSHTQKLDESAAS